MKTIEEKAKAYDEIIERAKTMLAAGKVMYGKENNASQLITDIIPELRESEDERIRRELIEYLRGDLDDITTDDTDRWIAWIEKQKEQKPHRFCDDTLEAIDKAREFDEQEQKLVEKQDYSGLTDFERAIHRGFLCAGVENVPVTIIRETAQDCLAHLPAEWNEEDEEIIANAIKQLYSYANSYHNANNDTREKEVRKVADKLQSLRPQPKQGKKGLILTEEQEKEFGHLFSYPHWKPSEEQVQAITYLASSIPPNFLKEQEYTMRLVDEVIEQLKKL